MSEDREKDHLSGVETTGHEWDGIKELNNPLPRWWLWVFYITIIWSIGYWIVYPSWPTLTGEGVRGGTRGTAGWTQYSQLEQSQAEIMARRDAYLIQFQAANNQQALDDPALYNFAMVGGSAAFKDNCATCHGSGGGGAPGYPNLNDDDWLWGGRLSEIYQTIKFGVRVHDQARMSMMPNYNDILQAEEIDAVAQYVSGLSAGTSRRLDESLYANYYDTLSLGAQIYGDQCAACHGLDGAGNTDLGAPNLADAIWLKSRDGSAAAIAAQVKQAQHGLMPAWVDRLDETTLRQLAIYVHELGGGEGVD